MHLVSPADPEVISLVLPQPALTSHSHLPISLLEEEPGGLYGGGPHQSPSRFNIRSPPKPLMTGDVL